MSENDSQRQVSPLLKRLQTTEQAGIRNFFRTVGPLIFGAGLLCTIGGMVSFFSSFGSFEPPRHFWLCFVGMPLMFIGGILSKLGYMGTIVRYIAGESAPVATDTINYVADETQGAVQTMAKSAAQGIAEGLAAGKAKTANFCPQCGTSVQTDFKFCPDCGKQLLAK